MADLDGGAFFKQKRISSFHDLMAKYKCPYCKNNSIEVICSAGFGATSFFFCNRPECGRLIATGPASSIGLNANYGQASKNKLNKFKKKLIKLKRKIQIPQLKDLREQKESLEKHKNGKL